MTELKTLKDILEFHAPDDKLLFEYEDNEKIPLCARESVLRAEAIKWIKELRDPKINREFRCIIGDYEILDVDEPLHIINWIKHFFNITEEDLKGEETKWI